MSVKTAHFPQMISELMHRLIDQQILLRIQYICELHHGAKCKIRYNMDECDCQPTLVIKSPDGKHELLTFQFKEFIN